MHQSEHIGLYINIASHYIRRRADSFSALYGLTGIQSRILSYLGSVPEREIFQKDIEKQFGIRRSSVTSVISNLEQNGFLTRQAVPGDARLKKLVLTENGIAVNQKISQSISDFEFSLSNCFTSDEKQELLRMLKTIINELSGELHCEQKKYTDKFEQGKDETLC